MELQEAEVTIRFDLNAIGDIGIKKLHQIEDLFLEIGVRFDLSSGLEGRDWDLDWSLKGPVKVLHKRLKEEAVA